MRTKEEIINLLYAKRESIISNISKESIDVFDFIKFEYGKTDVSSNSLFQFVYRSFYRLDNAGLTDEFKIKYFYLMQEYRNKHHFDFENILRQLKAVRNLQDQETFQFFL